MHETQLRWMPPVQLTVEQAEQIASKATDHQYVYCREEVALQLIVGWPVAGQVEQVAGKPEVVLTIRWIDNSLGGLCRQLTGRRQFRLAACLVVDAHNQSVRVTSWHLVRSA